MPTFRTSTAAVEPSLPVESSGFVLPPFVHEYLANGAAEGQRNATLHKAAQQFLAAKLSQAEAEARLTPRALSDGLRPAEIAQAIRSAYKSTAVVDPLETSRRAEPAVAKPAKALGFMDALKAAFLPGEFVAVVEARQNEDGDWKPSVATIKTLEKWGGYLEKAGSIDKLFGGGSPGGAFIAINPLKPGSESRSNDNVATFRHVLAEWDDLSFDEQHKRLLKSGLPLSAIVTSGGKSCHGWVRVDAKTREEWEKRRDEVHALLGCDPKNKDLARVSRCPGAHRGDKEQRVMAVRVGAKSWDAWKAENGWTPEVWGVLDLQERGPEPPPEVVCGVLRRGCHLQISSGPKMRKSYALIDLALSVATGSPWLGLQTSSGSVYYADAENQLALIRQRITPIAKARGIALDAALNKRLVFSALRGKLRGKTLPEIVQGVTRAIRSMDEPPVLAILEPLYLLLRGAKENEAEAVTAAMEELDEVCQQAGCAIAYVHHFSKGNQSLKSSMDRSSGSGALSRFPDAIMTLTPPPEEVPKRGKKEEPQWPDCDAVCEVTTRWFPPRDAFALYWHGAHYDSRKAAAATPTKHKPESMASKYGSIVKTMPPKQRHQEKERCDVCNWIAFECKTNLQEAQNIFGSLRSGSYHDAFLTHREDGLWQGTDWSGDDEAKVSSDEDEPF